MIAICTTIAEKALLRILLFALSAICDPLPRVVGGPLPRVVGGPLAHGVGGPLSDPQSRRGAATPSYVAGAEVLLARDFSVGSNCKTTKHKFC